MKREFGCTRTVYLVGRWAIKLPSTLEWRLFLLGLLGNMQEARISRMHERLCPVVWAAPGGLLLIMRRAAPLTDDEFQAMDYRTFVRPHDDLHLPVEPKTNSFGWLNGRVVAVDYGCSAGAAAHLLEGET